MTPLDAIIRDEIRSAGPMRFDRFMDLALYHPVLGYYSKAEGPSPIGRGGDFYTSVSVGPLFGHLLGRQFFEMWELMDRPNQFWIVEQGAHDGQLACDILEWARAETPEFLEAIRYAIVQAAGALSRHQQCAPDGELISYIGWFESMEALAAEKPAGVYFSNELPDAFPVRVIQCEAGQWWERHVGVEGDTLVWTTLPLADEELLQAIDDLGLPCVEGFITEINLAARHWMAGVARAMVRGYVLTIDYGFPASIYYADFRDRGTLTSYVKHKSNDDVLAEPGLRDLTAHVDFTALARVGTAAGWTTLGFLDQQRFLTGIAHDEMNGTAGPRVKIQANLRAWNTLTRPEFLGRDFQVLLQARDAPGGLAGLRFARPGGLD